MNTHSSLLRLIRAQNLDQNQFIYSPPPHLSIEKKNCDPANSDGRCCHRHKCGLGEGDCDRDTDCAANLVCGRDNCRAGDRSMDCCESIKSFVSSQKITLLYLQDANSTMESLPLNLDLLAQAKVIFSIAANFIYYNNKNIKSALRRSSSTFCSFRISIILIISFIIK